MLLACFEADLVILIEWYGSNEGRVHESIHSYLEAQVGWTLNIYA